MLPWWVFAIGSAIFTTLFNIFRKRGTKREHAMEFELTRAVFVVIFSLFLIPFLTLKYSLVAVLLIYFVSLIATLGILLNAKAVRHMQISEVAPLFNLTPGFLAVLAFFFLGESLSKIQIGGLILLIFGSYVLETDHNSFFKSFVKHMRSKYVVYAITAALIFSITSLLDKYTVSNYVGPFEFFVLVWFFIAINFTIISSIQYDGLKGIKHCLKIAKYNVVLASFFSFIANALYFYSLSLAYISLVLPIKRLSTLLTTIIGGELFHEKAILRKSIACAIMVVGAVLVIL